jgi:hypothetical protein
MSTHQDIIKNRRLVKAGIVLGYAAAGALTIARFANTDPATLGEAFGSVALGLAMATPATLAGLSLDQRPTLLPAAAITALLTAVVATVLLPVALITAFIWYRAWTERPVPAVTTPARSAVRIGLGFLLLAAMLTLFVHVDPVCTQILTDGSERSVDPASRGYTTGWALGFTEPYSSMSSISQDVGEEVCTSNTVVLGEALTSLALTALVLEIGRRWPRGAHAQRSIEPEAGATNPPSEHDAVIGKLDM